MKPYFQLVCCTFNSMKFWYNECMGVEELSLQLFLCFTGSKMSSGGHGTIKRLTDVYDLTLIQIDHIVCSVIK